MNLEFFSNSIFILICIIYYLQLYSFIQMVSVDKEEKIENIEK